MTTPAPKRAEPGRKGVTINIRASAQEKYLIDQAADAVGKTRTEFMLEGARRYAEDVLLDQRLFVLDADRYADFLRRLDAPPPPTQALRDLFATRSPWET